MASIMRQSVRYCVLLVVVLTSLWFSGVFNANTRLQPGNDPGSATTIKARIELPVITDENWGSASGSSRIMVLLNTAITDQILADLASYGTVHGWIDRYRMVAMRPTAGNLNLIEILPYVESVERDDLRFLTDLGTWDLDILDVTDVEESGTQGDPDRREVDWTGAGVHIAIIDTGLTDNWRDYLNTSRVDADLARSFLGGGVVGDGTTPVNEFHVSDPQNIWEHDTCGHGLLVTSFVAGFKAGPFILDGAAPGARVIPLQVFDQGCISTFSSRVIAAIDYVTGLVESGSIGPAVINLSLGGPVPNALEERAINDAIAAGVVVVAAAANAGENGMGWPGAYPQVISAGSIGWTKQFRPGSLTNPNLDFWWTQDVGFDPDTRRPSGPFEDSEAFVSLFSSRAIFALGQQLDVLAPGQAVVGPFGFPSFPVPTLAFVSGTSFSSPLTAGTAALMLEKNSVLNQADIEAILRSTSLSMQPVDSRPDVLRFFAGIEGPIFWDDDCSGRPCDPVGAGLLQADAALNAVPRTSR